MANSPHPSLFLSLTPIFTLFIILTQSISCATFRTPQTPIRVSLKRRESKKSLESLQLLRRSPRQGSASLSKIMKIPPENNKNDVRVPAYAGESAYLLNISIGTPPIPFSGIMDTGSQLVWTQCQPCVNCFEQPTPLFYPKNSSSFKNVSRSNELCRAVSSTRSRSDGCEYSYRYTDAEMTEGFLAFERLTFGENDESNVRVAFGCGVNNERKGSDQGTGVIGLSRGRLSLVSQLGVKEFSYCLASAGENRTSSLWLGSVTSRNLTGNKQTPLKRSSLRPAFYYLSLKGITVGKTLLPIPESAFELREDGSGGTIIDSGTTISYLQQDAFGVVKQAFATQMNLTVSDSELAGLDLCFDLPLDGDGYRTDVDVPRLVFHFEGTDLEFPRENYMITMKGFGLICLAMHGRNRVSILGNVLQQNMLIVHDLEKEVVSFVPAECDKII